MTDNSFPFLNNDWLKLQERYWQAWSDMNRFTSGTGAARTSSSRPWNQAIDQWWEAVSPKVSNPAQDFIGHLVGQGKSFFSLSENLLSSFTQASKVPGGDWQRLLDKAFTDMKTAVGATVPNGQESLGEMLAFWELPMDTWQRTMSVMSGVPGDLMQPLKSLTSHQQLTPVRDQLNKFLSVPGVGYAREHQEQQQKLMQMLLDYQAAYEAYEAEYAKIAESSVERFQSKVMEAIERKESVDTLQGLFNLWVDACEEAYADRVFSEEYARVHGRLVNTLMAVKKQGQAIIDEALSMLNIPTREDMTSVQERYQGMRRELREMRERMDRLEQQRQASATPAHRPVPAPRVRKKAVSSATRKKATRKTTATRAGSRRAGTGREDQS